MLERSRGLIYTLCDLAVKCPDAFVPFSIMVLGRVIVLVSNGLRLVTHAKVIGGRFYRKINGHITAAS